MRIWQVPIVFGLLSGFSALAADVKPIDTRSPVFRIYVASPNPTQQRLVGGPQVTFDARRPALIVSDVRAVKEDRNGKHIVMILNDKDRKTFSNLTRSFPNGLLLIEGQGSVLSAMHVTQPLDTGTLDFAYPEDARVIDYLRRRFALR